MSYSLWPHVIVANQAPLPMEFSRQEYLSGLLFPSPGDLPNSGIKPSSLVSPTLAGGFVFFFFFLTTSATYEAHCSSHISSAQKRWSEQLRKVLAWPNQMWFWSLFYQWLLVVRCLVFHTYIQADRYTRRSVRLSGNQQLFLILLLFFKK